MGNARALARISDNFIFFLYAYIMYNLCVLAGCIYNFLHSIFGILGIQIFSVDIYSENGTNDIF